MKNWVLPSGAVHWDYISKTYSDQEVTVANCAVRDFSDQERETMRVSDAVKALVNTFGDGMRHRLPYIKDWHLVMQSASLENQNDRLPYETPDISKDDCMPSVCTIGPLMISDFTTLQGLNNVKPGQDDFRFCYAGVAGSFTPLHCDVCKFSVPIHIDLPSRHLVIDRPDPNMQILPTRGRPT